ncbi:MAG: flagellar hook protein FlgE [Pseudomonadota bacterium]
MSIGSALQTGVNGLRAQATKIATISDNIANSATIGYKRSDTRFSSLVVNGLSASSYTAGGVTTNVRQEISTTGAIISTTTDTDLAVQGEGFFAVSTRTDGSGPALTRAGSFRPDENGDLRNDGGYYLRGFSLNADGTFANGAPSLSTFDSLETVNIANLQGSAQATSEVNYSGNLPADTSTLPAPVEFQNSVQAFDALGAASTVTLNWSQAVPGSNIWDLQIYDGTVAAGTLVTTLSGIDFSGAGGGGFTPGTPDYTATATTAAPAGYAVGVFDPATGTLPVTIPGPAGPASQTINIAIGAEGTLEGVTQFGGDFTPLTSVDGSSLGQLESVDFAEDGTMIAIFDNGEIRPIYQIPLANVLNPNGLGLLDGNAYALSNDSGELALQLAPNRNVGFVQSGALESANVDIATELTDLIETQRAYSSNATVIQTADEMLEEVTRLGR